jgi:hypothetical protein
MEDFIALKDVLYDAVSPAAEASDGTDVESKEEEEQDKGREVYSKEEEEEEDVILNPIISTPLSIRLSSQDGTTDGAPSFATTILPDATTKLARESGFFREVIQKISEDNTSQPAIVRPEICVEVPISDAFLALTFLLEIVQSNEYINNEEGKKMRWKEEYGNIVLRIIIIISLRNHIPYHIPYIAILSAVWDVPRYQSIYASIRKQRLTKFCFSWLKLVSSIDVDNDPLSSGFYVRQGTPKNPVVYNGAPSYVIEAGKTDKVYYHIYPYACARAKILIFPLLVQSNLLRHLYHQLHFQDHFLPLFRRDQILMTQFYVIHYYFLCQDYYVRKSSRCDFVGNWSITDKENNIVVDDIGEYFHVVTEMREFKREDILEEFWSMLYVGLKYPLISAEFLDTRSAIVECLTHQQYLWCEKNMTKILLPQDMYKLLMHVCHNH